MIEQSSTCTLASLVAWLVTHFGKHQTAKPPTFTVILGSHAGHTILRYISQVTAMCLYYLVIRGKNLSLVNILETLSDEHLINFNVTQVTDIIIKLDSQMVLITTLYRNFSAVSCFETLRSQPEWQSREMVKTNLYWHH